MEQFAILLLMYVAVGAGLFAQPSPGSAEAPDFTAQAQLRIFRATFADVLAWPVVLMRRLG